MTIDWRAFDQDVEEALDRAEERTDERLAGRISSLTRLTDEEIQEMFPTPGDVKKLAALMKIVKSAEDRNTKIANLESNIESLAGTMVTLLEKLA